MTVQEARALLHCEELSALTDGDLAWLLEMGWVPEPDCPLCRRQLMWVDPAILERSVRW